MMMRNKLNNTLYIFCISLLFGDLPSFDISYERKYGDGKSTDSQGNIINENYLFNEEFLKINSSYKDYHLYLEFEYSDSPILGFSRQEFRDILSKYYIEKSSDKLYLKLGNIYSLYGAGLGVYTFPDQSIDFDNSIEGFEFKFNLTQSIESFVLYGSSYLEQRTNPAVVEPDRFGDNDIQVFGFNYNTPWVYGHILSKTQESVMDIATVQSFWIDEGNRTTLLDYYIGEQFEDASLIDVGATLNTETINLGLGGFSSWLDFYFEGEWSDYTKLLGDEQSGHRYYLSLGTNIGDYGLSYEFKDYDMAYDILTFSAPPTVAIESTSILAARNSHSMSYGDEVGHQFEVVGPAFGGFNFLGNISIAGRHKAKSKSYLTSGDTDLYSSLNSYQSQEVSSIEEIFSTGDPSLQPFFALSSDDLNTSLTYNDFNQPSISDYLSFNSDLDEFKAFYPYQQVYAEFNGYVRDNLYIKIGYDSYKEVLKYKNEVTYQNSEELKSATNLFLIEAEQTVQSMSDAAENSGLTFDMVVGLSPDQYLAQFSLPPEEIVEEGSYEYVRAWTIPTQVTYDLGGGNSVNSYLEYQSKTVSQASGDNLYKGSYFSGSYTSKGFWTATLFYEREDIEFFSGFIKKGLWRGVDLSFDLGDKGQLSIFKGSQKGGRVCANGICADQPGFEDGVKVTYRTFF